MARTKRNDLCPCSSGKKYKKCCMNKTLAGLSPSQRLIKHRNVWKEPLGEPEKVNKLKGVQGGLCNVTRCQSPEDVNYCNEWNGNMYYCLSCAIDFTDHDEKWTEGYRFNCFVPHPLLCSQEEVEWFLNKRNTFSVPVELREDGYWFNDFGNWFKVPSEKRRNILVFDTHPMDPGTLFIVRPNYRSGKSIIETTARPSQDTRDFVWDNETYVLTGDNDERRIRPRDYFCCSKGTLDET